MPALRSDSALIAFRRKLEQLNYDMRAWRAQQVRSGNTCPFVIQLHCIMLPLAALEQHNRCARAIPLFITAHLHITSPSLSPRNSISGPFHHVTGANLLPTLHGSLHKLWHPFFSRVANTWEHQ